MHGEGCQATQNGRMKEMKDGALGSKSCVHFWTYETAHKIWAVRSWVLALELSASSAPSPRSCRMVSTQSLERSLTCFFCLASGRHIACRRAEACRGKMGQLADLDSCSQSSLAHLAMVRSWYIITIKNFELVTHSARNACSPHLPPPVDRHGVQGGLL